MSALEKLPVLRTGPVVFRDCGSCEGVGRQGCPNCKGTGRITVDIHPFGTLEALVENLQSVVHSFPGLDENSNYQAAMQYAQSLFQQLILILPEEYERTEGESS